MKKIINRIYPSSLTAAMLLVYSGSVLYIIPWQSFSHLRVFLPVITTVLFWDLLREKIKLNKFDLTLCVMILFLALINFSVSKFGIALLIVILLITFRHPQELSRRYLTFLYLCFLISIIYQFLTFRTEIYEYIPSSLYRFSLYTIPDPNFSGLFILLFFFFCWKNSFKVGILLSIISIFLLSSRGYLMAMLIFMCVFTLEKFSPRFFINKRFWLLTNHKRYFLTLILISNLLIFAFGTFYVYNIKLETIKIKEANERLKLENIADPSNMERFLASEKTIQLLTENLDILLYGIPKSAFGDDINPSDSMKKILNSNVPHNSVLYFVLSEGILFCIPYFYALGKILSRLYSPENLKYILPYIVFSLVLHGFDGGAPVVFRVVTLSLLEFNPKNKVIGSKLS